MLFSIGFDAFGLPSEIGAIKNELTPQQWVEQCRARMHAQFDRLGYSFDWEREWVTSLSGALQVDAVAVPAAAQTRARLPRRRPGRLVRHLQDGARLAAGRGRRLLALPRAGETRAPLAVVPRRQRLPARERERDRAADRLEPGRGRRAAHDARARGRRRAGRLDARRHPADRLHALQGRGRQSRVRDALAEPPGDRARGRPTTRRARAARARAPRRRSARRPHAPRPRRSSRPAARSAVPGFGRPLPVVDHARRSTTASATPRCSASRRADKVDARLAPRVRAAAAPGLEAAVRQTEAARRRALPRARLPDLAPARVGRADPARALRRLRDRAGAGGPAARAAARRPAPDRRGQRARPSARTSSPARARSAAAAARRETDTLDCHVDGLWQWLPFSVPAAERESRDVHERGTETLAAGPHRHLGRGRRRLDVRPAHDREGAARRRRAAAPRRRRAARAGC